MKKAPRFPSRWAGRLRTLGTTATLSVALGACSNFMGAREGTMEYPGSAAGPNAVAVYVVKDKDTVESLSQRYGVSAQTIIDRNRLQQPYTLRAGQTLEMPGAKFVPDGLGGASVQTAAANPNAPGPVKREALAAPTHGEPPRSAAPAGTPTPLSPSSQSVTVAATPPASTPATTPPATSASRFAWPVRGKIVSSYGTSGGQKNDGIDIQAEKGAPVKAADGGTVVYAGNEVKGMGNLLLVQHAGGYITAYGHNEALLVKKGDTVKKGQTIAKVGDSGGAPEPRLHFEVRRSGKTVDPATVLPAP
jgi:murein DD-endopeptidase MepM/ murein hydrolase activator NlpD